MGYCTWAGMNEANQIYHDTEWGIPVHDDRHMFEHLTLECLQCGLSWDLMLKKRGFRYVGPVTVYSHLQVCGIINDYAVLLPPKWGIRSLYHLSIAGRWTAVFLNSRFLTRGATQILCNCAKQCK